MDPEEKDLLEKTVELTEENNKMLKSMRRTSNLRTAFSIIYWTIIIGVAIGAYYYIEPYIKDLLRVYTFFTKIGA